MPAVNWNWKWFRLATLVALLAGGAGCGGLQAGKSISPATFLLPGLLKYEAPPVPDAVPVLSGPLLTQN